LVTVDHGGRAALVVLVKPQPNIANFARVFGLELGEVHQFAQGPWGRQGKAVLPSKGGETTKLTRSHGCAARKQSGAGERHAGWCARS
jgi:hypothetical protein